MSLFSPEIQSVLDRLRQRIRRYLVVEGLSKVLIVLCGLFIFSFVIDALWFRLTRLELPGWFRQAFLIFMVGILAGMVVSWVILRLTQKIRGKALALVLERRFKHLNDRLITAVELGDEAEEIDSIKSAMARRTVKEAGEEIRGLDLDQVFDNQRLKVVITIASVLFAAIALFGLLNAPHMQRWVNAFLFLQDDYWDPFRKSNLTVKILAQPGDRIREFGPGGVYRHPRGADLTLIIESNDGAPPEEVTVYSTCYASTGTRTDDSRAARVRQTEYRHTIQSVTDDHELVVMGGDFRNRLPLKIEVVDPPRIAQVRLECDYPEYIGREGEEGTPVVVQGSQVTLPMETGFQFVGGSNKPLRGFQVRSPSLNIKFGLPLGAEFMTPRVAFDKLDEDDDGNLSVEEISSQVKTLGINEPRWLLLEDLARQEGFDPDRDIVREEFERYYHDSALTATLEVHAEEGSTATLINVPTEQTASWFTPDRETFSVPFHLGLGSADALAQAAGSETGEIPIPLPPDLPLQITLEDQDDIFSQEPSRLTIRGQVDQPPVIETQRTGVSGSITRMATVPITGNITDDYGVASADFGFRTDANSELSESEMSREPGGATEFELQTSEDKDYEVFDVLPLALQVGGTLTLTVIAHDGDNINGPHRSQGEMYEFVIVPPEEILALLADKELNLRQRLEQIERDLQAVQVLLADARNQVAEREDVIGQGGSALDLERLSGLIDAAQERTVSDVRQNHTETQAIAQQMQEIRAEMINNRIDSVEMLDRIDRGILAHLRIINEQDFPEVHDALGLYGLLNQSRANPTEHIDAASLALDNLLQRIAIVLAEMRRRESFNELRDVLAQMLERQRAILEETREEQTRDLFNQTE